MTSLDNVSETLEDIEGGEKGDAWLDNFEQWLNSYAVMCGPEDHFLAMRILNAVPYSLLKYDEFVETMVANSLDRARSLYGSPAEQHQVAADEAVDRAQKLNDQRALINGMIKRAVDVHNFHAAEFSMGNPDNYTHRPFGALREVDTSVKAKQAAIDALAKEMHVELKSAERRETTKVPDSMLQTFERYEKIKEVQ